MLWCGKEEDCGQVWPWKDGRNRRDNLEVGVYMFVQAYVGCGL